MDVCEMFYKSNPQEDKHFVTIWIIYIRFLFFETITHNINSDCEIRCMMNYFFKRVCSPCLAL